MPPTKITEEHRIWARKALPEINEDLESGKEMIERVARQIANAESRQQTRDLGGIRVLRLLEYVYPDVKTMSDDMGRWQIPSGSYRPNGRVTIRSSVLPLAVLDPTAVPVDEVRQLVTDWLASTEDDDRQTLNSITAVLGLANS